MFAPMASNKSTKYATFKHIKEKIELRLQKEYNNGNDVAKSINKMARIDFNALKLTVDISTSMDPKVAKQENKANLEAHKYLMQRHIDCMEVYVDSMKSVYALIINKYCTTAMVTSLKQLPTFKSKIKNNPINLLKAIAEAIHTPIVNQYHFETLINAFIRWLTDKQQKNESIDNYLAQNRHYTSIVEAQLGKTFSGDFTTHTVEYKSATSNKQRDRLIDGAWATWKAYLFWRNSNNDKYGELKATNTLVKMINSQRC